MRLQFSEMLKRSPLMTESTVPTGTSPLNTKLDSGFFGSRSRVSSSGSSAQTTLAQPVTPSSTVVSQGFGDFEQQVIDLTNQERTQRGLAPLSMNLKLNVSAEKHSQEMATKNYFSHQGSNGSQPWDRMRVEGYNYSRAAENIAFGQTTPQQVVNDWMNSTGHRQNILNANLKDIGVGYYNGYWTQNFGTLMAS
jgi:uncharacterized protein YkwD